MDYLLELRKEVGNRPLVVAGTLVMVLNEKNEVLLIHRKDNGFWGLPGGSVELQEKVEETAKRELFEETGLVGEQLQLFHVISGPECFYTYPNGDQCSFVATCFYTRIFSGNLLNETEETKNSCFVSLEALPESIAAHEMLAIDYFKQHYQK